VVLAYRIALPVGKSVGWIGRLLTVGGVVGKGRWLTKLDGGIERGFVTKLVCSPRRGGETQGQALKQHLESVGRLRGRKDRKA